MLTMIAPEDAREIKARHVGLLAGYGGSGKPPIGELAGAAATTDVQFPVASKSADRRSSSA
jgi:hypothetical protein